MKRKTFFGRIAAKFAAALLLVAGVSGCYKDPGLDIVNPGGGIVIPDASYSISGMVTDIETGAPVNVDNVSATTGTVKLVGNGSFNVSLKKDQVPAEGVTVNLTIEAKDYKTVERSVYIEQIPDGTTVVYPVSVVMKKDVAPIEYVDVVYDLSFVVKNAKTGEVVDGIEPAVKGTPDSDGNYPAGDYIVTTDEVEDEFYASTTVISLPEQQVVKGENNVKTRMIEIAVSPMDVPAENIRIYGEVVDSRGFLAHAQTIRLAGSEEETILNAANFSFTIDKAKAAESYQVVATIKNADESGVLTMSAKVEMTEAMSYYVLVVFPCEVENGKEVIPADGGAVGIITPRIVSGVVEETVEGEMADGTHIALFKDTRTNLDGSVIVKRNLPAEGVSNEPVVSVRSYIGLPEGTTFEPGLNISWEDVYAGEFGDALKLQYQGTDGNWTTDAAGSVAFAEGRYTMKVPHFSAFRAALVLDPKANVAEKEDNQSFEVNMMNSSEEPIVDFKLTYKGYAGARYVDYAKLESDIRAAFGDETEDLVLAAVKAICPEAALGFEPKQYESFVTIPGWYLLNTADVKIITEETAYELEINGKKIAFTVEAIVSVEVSATEKNMTHMGHGHGHDHGHGHGDANNAGGGIIVNE